MQKLIVTLALGAAMISTPALAQDGNRGGAFMQRDQTRAEAQQRADTMFQMLDANKDGTVTNAEADEALAQFQAARGDDDNGGRGAGRMQRMIHQGLCTAQALTQAQVEEVRPARVAAAGLHHDRT